MGPSPVLVDSSFYIGLLRQGKEVLPGLMAIAEYGDLVTCGVVCAEVGRGLISPKMRETFKSLWEVMQYVPTDQRLWEEVEALAWTLDRKGKTLPLQDIVIACCARRAEAVVLTLDHHFFEIPDLRVATGLDEI